MAKAAERGGGDEGGRGRKLPKGRKKIPIELIGDLKRRQTTFAKRRKGLIKKAFELSVLSGAQVGLVAFSPAGKAYSYSESSLDAVLDRLRGRSSASRPAPVTEEAVAKLLRQEEELIKARDAELRRGKKIDVKMRTAGVRIDGDVRSWDLPEQQAVLGAVELVEAEVAARANGIFAQEAMMHQCMGGGADGNLLGYSGHSYTPDISGVHEEAAMYTTMNLMGSGTGNNRFDYLGSGSFAVNGTGGYSQTLDTPMRMPAGDILHYNNSSLFLTHDIDEVTVDTTMKLMGGNLNHAVPSMMCPPPPLALPFDHGYGYNEFNVADYGYNDFSVADYGYNDLSVADYGYNDLSVADYGYNI